MTWLDGLRAYGLGAVLCGLLSAGWFLCGLHRCFDVTKRMRITSLKTIIGIGIIAGVLWPLTVIVGVGLLPGVIASGARALRSLRPPRSEKVVVPRATARPVEVDALIARRKS